MITPVTARLVFINETAVHPSFYVSKLKPYFDQISARAQFSEEEDDFLQQDQEVIDLDGPEVEDDLE